MSLGRLLHKGLGVALDAPTLRALSGTATGTLIASTAGPVYRTIHDHFTLSGHELATALGDSFSRGLTAIDDELNGWRISRALGSKLRRDYQARIRTDFLDPYATEHGLDDATRKALCQTLNQHSARLIDARERLFPAAELPEPDIAELLASDAGGISELLLERIEQTIDPLPEDLRGFLIYRDLLGDAVLYFFRETLRRDPRVEATLNALQQAGLRQDSRQLQQQLHALHAQQAQLQDALTEALQARDRTRRNELMEQIDRLDDLLADVQIHQQRLDAFRQQFADWSGYLDVRLDELQNALVGEIRQVGDQVQQGFEVLQQRFDALLRHLHDVGLGERIRPEDEFHPPPARLLREVEQTTDVLRQSTRYRARAGILQASVLAAVGDRRQAEQQLTDALSNAETDTDKALAHYNLFQLALQRDDKPAALDHLKQAAALDPQYALWRIGKHTPERILGAGGMGLALLVRNRLDQQRVLKLLWSDDEAAAERFHQEALTMARIAGEHVPSVHDFDHADPVNHQRPYLEMEYLPDSLDGEAWLSLHGPLSLEQGLHVARQIARVLLLAHAQGIHHHDLKPANLLLQATDQGLKITVIDFGLSSKVIELHQRLGRGSVSGKSVMARQVFGSLDYAPPEQRGMGHQPGPWSDLYSLAITLYRLLTNAPPNPPNPFLLPDDRDFQQLLFQCLHHDTEQRPTAEQFLERLVASPPLAKGSGSAAGGGFPFIHGWNTEQVQKLQQDTARNLNLAPVFRDRLKDGSAGPAMVVIPAGRFLMGSPKNEAERNNNERQHEVTIEQPFALGKYPVTFDEYDRFCNATGHDKPEDLFGRGRQPVYDVDWYDAMAYCAWLSEQTGQTYRLPSEAEWEYACRAGTTTPFHFGETISTDQANYDGTSTYGNGIEGEFRDETTPVGQYPANAWGLHDLHGNVEEWTGSEYDENYTGPEQWLLAADAADDVHRVARGGMWQFMPDGVRSAYRCWDHPDLSLGLRLARSPFQCLHHDTEQRPTAGQFLERLAASPPLAKEAGSEASGGFPFIHGWNTEQVQKLQQATARNLNLKLVFRDRLKDGSEGPAMVIIPAGRFLMGSPEDEAGRGKNERQHEVTIEQPFALGKYPVTFDEYDRFCNATGRDKPEDEWGRGRQPVINVSWYDAMAYSAWLSAMTGHEYRLPSEAEWEYACRAGTTTPFHFGDTIGTEQANYDGNDTYGNGVKGEYREKTTPVGQFPANAWGLHDLHGNVWELTGSEYDENYTGSEQWLLAADPEQWLLAADAAVVVRWVVRGGSWGSDPHWVRSAARYGGDPDNRLDIRGLRLSRSL